MEKDAVETLVFMSSPKNSGYYPKTNDNSQLLGTPLRNQVDHLGTLEREHNLLPNTSQQRSYAGRLRTDGDVERMLDEISAGESTSEDELPGPRIRV